MNDEQSLIHVVGARPNFIKVAPVMAAVTRLGSLRQVLVHTGQHYDDRMSDVFFRELGMPAPDVNLDTGSGSHAVQTGQVMMRLESLFSDSRPDLVLVYGDVNSTLAASLVCAKMQIPLGHVEAGLRSFDRSMPEEVNRIVTDRLADLLFTPSADADNNLLREGVSSGRIHFVGNVMIDTLIALLPKARRPDLPGLSSSYCLVTLHRPSNVDDPAALKGLMAALSSLGRDLPVLFPVHPRTRARLNELQIRRPASVTRDPSAGGRKTDDGRRTTDDGLRLLDPLGYLEFLGLEREATMVITDSGGVQEETTYLGVPCLTVRENTERPVTCELGTNTLVGRSPDRLLAEARSILAGTRKTGRIPPLWDGHAGERIADIVERRTSSVVRRPSPADGSRITDAGRRTR
jgi:UDP-N-acetylglucosamine 2-epimerase (non-hydrolysing)